MNITLALIGLSDKQVCYMSSDVILVTDSVSAKDFLQPRMLSAFALDNTRLT